MIPTAPPEGLATDGGLVATVEVGALPLAGGELATGEPEMGDGLVVQAATRRTMPAAAAIRLVRDWTYTRSIG